MSRRQGPIAALVLLVGIILGTAPSAAADFNNRSARLAPVETAKAAPALRTAIRGQADEDAEPVFLAAVPPARATRLVPLHQGASGAKARARFAPAPAPSAYRARAPPAA